ncbi:hypothetical protein [uncultured Psychroserpens sp.]|uniref:hypothetical protein n=1 Tax=uncultured Psychroserpens sp. TaxID=255436 RepID=UPI00261F6E31|nr:hypothetical protein [uncultured Psychroserpens sp.]
MKKTIAWNMVCLTLLLASCSSDNSDDAEMNNPEDSTVYVVGSNANESDTGDSELDRALLWVDEELTVLTNGQTNAEAFSVFVSGDDVYVAGYEELGNGISIAKYWKNGVSVNLSDGTRDAIAYDILVDGEDVYVVGEEDSEIPGGRNIATYWVNGMPTLLTDGTEFAAARALALYEGEIHIVGKEGSIAKYWVNGTSISLTDGTDSAFANDISIDQGEVYIALRENREINNDDIQVASYWNNNQITVLENNTSFAGAFGILADNDNLYVSGSSQAVGDSLILRFWLNGEIISDTIVGEISSIVKHGDDIYYAGFTGISLSSKATYWKNDAMVILPSDDFNYVRAYAIFVK